MKKRLVITSVFVSGLIGVLILSGCASTSIKELSGEEFVKQAKQIKQVHSFHWTTYVGNSSGRAYMEYQHPSLLYNIIGKQVYTTVYWTPISELPKDIAAKIKAGNAPWESPFHKNKE